MKMQLKCFYILKRRSLNVLFSSLGRFRQVYKVSKVTFAVITNIYPRFSGQSSVIAKQKQ